ncbi:hypothetical protein A9264_07090 [Vibrio sp. UCD-FRSSP16_10]|uniref:hypothetical protein n=1 Tax=unclassified Vibrio TaxID=2614977 RepID=UPI0007FED69F|nr:MULTISPECIES: hypothetical protein [unclassified Vibrio]OBT13426.1 hypothetical protein A9264_07090 [Vibrio sp. UCD-FRSSP16_10]OBT17936.1 hypothetical protein A9260_01080 [Vibrio sp. UCD-FRSSP16_30]
MHVKNHRSTVTKYLGSFLSLMLLSGCESTTESSVSIVPDAQTSIQKLVLEKILSPEGLGDSDAAFTHAYVDLNGDTEDELMVLMQDPYFCDIDGCSAFLFNSSQQLMATTKAVKFPILMTHINRDGWINIVVGSGNSMRLLQFNGQSYPTDASAEPRFSRKGRQKVAHDIVVKSDAYKTDGYELIERLDLPMFAQVEEFKYQFKRESDPNSVSIATVNTLTGSIFLSTESLSTE